MKIHCSVIQDLIPLYHDGVCSEESAVLVESHLEACDQCRRILGELREEIEVEKNGGEDAEPLKKLKKAWDAGNRKAMKKGACIALAVLMIVLSIWTGIWYFGYARYYDQMALVMDRVNDPVAALTTGGHTAVLGDYAYVLKKPGFLGEGGFVHVAQKDGMVIQLDENGEVMGTNREVYIDLFFYPRFGGGYQFGILTDYVVGDHVESGMWAWINPDLTLDTQDHIYTEDEIVEYAQLLEAHQEEIEGLFGAVYDLWGIRFLEK